MSEPQHEGRAVRQQITIRAPARAVYEAWAKPEQIARWFVDRAWEEMREGATVRWRFDAFDMEIPIEVYAAKPGERLLFGGERPDGSRALQEIVLEEDGGTTVLRLVNSGFGEGEAWDEEFEGVDSGWQLALAQLKHLLEHHPDAETSRNLLLMRPATFAYEALRPHHRTAEGLAGWLGDDVACDPDPLETGARVRMKVDGTLPLDGEVLAASDREVLFSWPEQQAALALKAFAAGPDTRMLALGLRTWGRSETDMAYVQGHLDAALGRLAARLA